MRYMKQLRSFLQRHLRVIIVLLLSIIALGFLYLYKLGSLVGGLSQNEFITASRAVGFGGIIADPLHLPINVIRSIVFALYPDHGQTLTRLPNVLMGGVAIAAFSWLIALWHGKKIALLAGLMFATSAWTLHVSRLATYDVQYFAAIPLLLLSYALLKRYGIRCVAHYLALFTAALLLYVPGLVWIIVPTIIVERTILIKGWSLHRAWWQRTLKVVVPLLTVGPLLYKLATDISLLKTWAGLPAEFAAPMRIAKEIVAIPVHLFIRGPQYPELWLGRAPIFDAFALVLVIAGMYFYAKHRASSRTKLLCTYALIGTILIALQGPVALSLLVPLLFVLLAMGATYLLHEWLKVFPKNPLPRLLGVGLLSIAVTLSCAYNLRAYFVAWPNNEATSSVFQYHR